VFVDAVLLHGSITQHVVLEAFDEVVLVNLEVDSRETREAIDPHVGQQEH